jgi:glutathione S-transferase
MPRKRCFSPEIDRSVRGEIAVIPSVGIPQVNWRDWLDGAFSAGDLLMVTVLLRLQGSGMLDEYPNLAAYLARSEVRPAYKRAFAAQLAVFTAASTG